VLPRVKKLMSCVRPGVLLTKARRRRLASVLMALDFPAFDRPANAISGAPGGGSAAGSWIDSANAALASGNLASGVFDFDAETPATVKFRVFAVPFSFFSFSRGF
jgi:hypothetical protein